VGRRLKAQSLFLKNHVENVTETADWPTIPVKVNGIMYKSPDVLVIGSPQTVWSVVLLPLQNKEEVSGAKQLAAEKI
jgi:hypothetical protein